MGKDESVPSRRADDGRDVQAFLDRLAATPAPRPKAGARARLIFAMDATASRQPAWDRAARIQGEMFEETTALGGLDVQLVFYRGFDEFKVSPWTSHGDDLRRLMTSVFCLAGETQLRKVLVHAANETRRQRVAALVFVGDAFEEDIDRVGAAAGELGLLGLPAFMFHEGMDPAAGFAFQQVAKLTGGAYVRFDASSPDALRRLLAAVAVYAAGGRRALTHYAKGKGADVLALTDQLGTAGRG